MKPIYTKLQQGTTRTTRTPAFWGYPRRLMIIPIPLSHIRSQVKIRQSQSYKFKEFAKIANFWIFKQTLHATHILKLLDKMCKYEMDPMSIVENTERTRFCPQTDRRTDTQTDRRTRWNQYTPFQFRWSGGYNNNKARSWMHSITKWEHVQHGLTYLWKQQPSGKSKIYFKKYYTGISSQEHQVKSRIKM